MGWTYTGNPQDSDRDLVRFLIGDHTQDAQSLSDEELDYLLAVNTDGATVNTYRAAAEAAGMLAVRYAGLATTMRHIGDLTLQVSYGEQATRFEALEAKLLKGRTNYDVGGAVFFDTSTNVFAIGDMDNGGGRFGRLL